jgi:hypothetical protein
VGMSDDDDMLRGIVILVPLESYSHVVSSILPVGS